MTEPIFDPTYWARRFEAAKQEHHAVFKCPEDRWLRIEAKHREILQRHVRRADSILDVGCGWGRLLSLLPPGWDGYYLGVDLSPTFIEKARERYPYRSFEAHDMREPLQLRVAFDWAVMISFRPMVLRNAGSPDWCRIEANVKAKAYKLLYLEYDEHDEGSVE